MEAASTYRDEQLIGYTEMVNRNNILHWTRQEVSLVENNHQPSLSMGETFDSIEADVDCSYFSTINGRTPNRKV